MATTRKGAAGGKKAKSGTPKRPKTELKKAPAKKQAAPEKQEPEKHAGGRPTDYRPEYVELGYKFALLGATDADLAKMFDVAESTINLWKLKHPEFSESVNKGKATADAEVAASLFHRAKGYSHDAVKIVADAKLGIEHIVPYREHYPPDTAAAIFWLKNRQKDKWRDKIEHTGGSDPDDTPVQHAHVHQVGPETLAAIERLNARATRPGK